MFAATVNDTGPLPLPDAPCVIEIHAAFDVAIHAQPPSVCTCTDTVPPAAAIDSDVADRL